MVVSLLVETDLTQVHACMLWFIEDLTHDSDHFL